MKLSHFEEVVAIAQRGSIRAAARHLQLDQPALTRRLSDLERELGAPLFERRAHGVSATAFGEAFLRRAVSIVNEVRRTREELDQLRGAGGGRVTVGLSIAAHLAILPVCLGPFRQRYPTVRLHIIEGFYPTLEAGLRDGSVDLYVGPDPGPMFSPDLHREMILKNRRTVLCRAGHPLAAKRSLADLCGADWVTTSITAEAEDEIGALFVHRGLPPPRLAVRSQSALTLMLCLSHSDLLAMVPVQWSEVVKTWAALTTIDVEDELSAAPIIVVRRTDLPLTPAASHFLDLVYRAKGQSGQPVSSRNGS